MFGQNKQFYPTFNENRGSYHQPTQRPHTPNTSNFQSLGMSRSLNKLQGQAFGALNPQNYNNPPHLRNISRSRVSMSNSQALQLTDLINEPDVFPD